MSKKELGRGEAVDRLDFTSFELTQIITIFSKFLDVIASISINVHKTKFIMVIIMKYGWILAFIG